MMLPVSHPTSTEEAVEVMDALAAAEDGDNDPTTADATEGTTAGPSNASGLEMPLVQNVVATVNLDCKLDLRTIAMRARNAEYNPKRFSAVIMRIRDPKATALIFASGKMVVSGAKSELFAKLAGRKFARILQKIGFEARFLEFRIQNMVGTTSVGFPLNLDRMEEATGVFSSYEPELFPGLIYRMIKPKVVLIMFVSGKVVITGGKFREDLNKAWEQMHPVLLDFRKVNMIGAPITTVE